MRFKKTISLLLIFLLSFHSYATVLSISSRFLSINDRGLIISYKKSAECHQMFLNACEISGLAEIIDMIRIISSVVLIGTQYNPKKPKEIYLRQLKRLAEDGLGRTGFNQLIMSSSVSASGGFVDFTFLGLQKNKDLNDQLMELLLGVLNVLNEGGEYINICSDLGLSEELQELKSEIMGLKQSK